MSVQLSAPQPQPGVRPALQEGALWAVQDAPVLPGHHAEPRHGQSLWILRAEGGLHLWRTRGIGCSAEIITRIDVVKIFLQCPPVISGNRWKLNSKAWWALWNKVVSMNQSAPWVTRPCLEVMLCVGWGEMGWDGMGVAACMAIHKYEGGKLTRNLQLLQPPLGFFPKH